MVAGLTSARIRSSSARDPAPRPRQTSACGSLAARPCFCTARDLTTRSPVPMLPGPYNAVGRTQATSTQRTPSHLQDAQTQARFREGLRHGGHAGGGVGGHRGRLRESGQSAAERRGRAPRRGFAPTFRVAAAPRGEAVRGGDRREHPAGGGPIAGDGPSAKEALPRDHQTLRRTRLGGRSTYCTVRGCPGLTVRPGIRAGQSSLSARPDQGR